MALSRETLRRALDHRNPGLIGLDRAILGPPDMEAVRYPFPQDARIRVKQDPKTMRLGRKQVQPVSDGRIKNTQLIRGVVIS